jgi:Protein of unknown function (DUF2892)
MKQNLGGADRAIRILLGVGLLTAMVLIQSNLRWWGLLGFLPLLTAYAGSCPLYSVFGISSCRAVDTSTRGSPKGTSVLPDARARR